MDHGYNRERTRSRRSRREFNFAQQKKIKRRGKRRQKKWAGSGIGHLLGATSALNCVEDIERTNREEPLAPGPVGFFTKKSQEKQKASYPLSGCPNGS